MVDLNDLNCRLILTFMEATSNQPLIKVLWWSHTHTMLVFQTKLTKKYKRDNVPAITDL